MKAFDLKKKLFGVPDNYEVELHLDALFDVENENRAEILIEDVEIHDSLEFVSAEEHEDEQKLMINLKW